jgi:hypothetical protein
VKTTLEIPDSVFRRAKARAAERGIPLRQFVTEAVEEKLTIKAPGSKLMLPAKFLVINENADYFWLDRGHWPNIRQCPGCK